MQPKAIKIAGAICGLLVLAAVCTPIWLGYRAYRQNGLDQELIAAVKLLDAPHVRRLLEEGASPNVTDAPVQRQSLWQCVVAEFKMAMYHRPMESPSHGDSAITIAVGMNSAAIVKLLLEHGAVGVNDDLSDTVMGYGPATSPLLCVASHDGNAAIVTALIQYGANLNATDWVGTALFWSVSMGSDDITRILLRAGADPDIPDKEGFSPFMVVAETSDVATARELLEAGANVNQLDQSGNTSLDYALDYGRPPVIKLLQNYGGKVSEKRIDKVKDY